MPADLTPRVQQFAQAAGFDLCGVAPIRDFAELQIFPAWIADGRHGEMKYLESRDEKGELKRASVARVAPWARSVIVCAINYNTAQPYSTQIPKSDTGHGWIARYAWAREDYHDSVLRRLRKIEDDLRVYMTETALQHEATGDGELQLRSYVDTGPLIERAYAKHAGIGWIGKNTCIINQKLGSWLFLGVILTSLNMSEGELTSNLPAPDRCGSCTRCIDACPTHAILAPGELDARLCISYLTIEKRGEIPVDLRAGIGRNAFGCDICQDVCPWNRKAPVTSAHEFETREGLVNPELEWLAGMQPEEFSQVFRGSPVRRAKLSGLRRNAVVAMGNSGDKKFASTLKNLSDDPDPIIAEHARWALQQLGAA